MAESFKYLFHYLEKESINIDKNEFLFQIQSHPDYPSLLSISDTLNFFQIDNGALTVSFSDLELLPNKFIVLLNNEDGMPIFHYVENKAGNFYVKIDGKIKSVTKENLEKKWLDTVFLVEKGYELKNNHNSFVTQLLFLASFFLISFLFFLDNKIQDLLFFCFPFLGIILSIASFKDLFGTKSELVNNFCNLLEFTSCDSVINSKKWKWFQYFNFGDLSIIFFTYQMSMYLMSLIIIRDLSNFYSFQSYLMMVSIPIILLSVYFQKFVEKKWCLICLAIISVLIFELIYFVFFKGLTTILSIYVINLNAFVLIFITIIWIVIKRMLSSLKELREFQFKANRFIRNYKTFKEKLVSQRKYEFPKTPLIFGNRESEVVISVITSPVCGFCKQAHELLQKLLIEHGDKIQIKLMINSDIDVESDEKKLFYRSFINVYLEHGEKVFLEAIHEWFENKNITTWLKSYKMTSVNTMGIDAIYYHHERWCKENQMNFTPAFFINGFRYPDETYDREILEYFIYDLIEDVV